MCTVPFHHSTDDAMILCLFLIFVLNHVLSSDVDKVVVNTKRGPIIGNKGNREFTAYYGVPYAKIDENNVFGNSVDYPHFNTPFDASNFSFICPQENRNENEILQCLNMYLTLDIYVPKTNHTNESMAVIVWFYGGGYIIGSAGNLGGKYLVKHGIIVVTVNYRIGPYGFLCLDDPSVPGNQGLKDQITALRWIKENIGAFGGDATKVTIAGQSFGGGSVDLHLYSMYETLFDKAIIQSGLKLNENMFTQGDYEAAAKLAKQLGHNPGQTKDDLKFLSKVDPLQVFQAAKNIRLQFRPCKEKHFNGVQSFLSLDSSYTQQSTKVKDVSIIIGYNSKEDFASFMNVPDDFYANLGNIFYKELENTFVLRRHELETLSKIVQAFYLGGKTITEESMLELSDFLSDIKLNHPVERAVNNYLKQGAGKVYKYLFSYDGGSSYKNKPCVGACHTEKLQYLFEIGLLNSDEQIMMANRMTEMWANFVKYGDPTPEVTELLPTKWVPVTNGTARPYLNIDVEMTMLEHVYHQRMAFWDLVWHQYR